MKFDVFKIENFVMRSCQALVTIVLEKVTPSRPAQTTLLQIFCCSTLKAKMDLCSSSRELGKSICFHDSIARASKALETVGSPDTDVEQ